MHDRLTANNKLAAQNDAKKLSGAFQSIIAVLFLTALFFYLQWHDRSIFLCFDAADVLSR